MLRAPRVLAEVYVRYRPSSSGQVRGILGVFRYSVNSHSSCLRFPCDHHFLLSTSFPPILRVRNLVHPVLTFELAPFQLRSPRLPPGASSCASLSTFTTMSTSKINQKLNQYTVPLNESANIQ